MNHEIRWNQQLCDKALGRGSVADWGARCGAMALLGRRQALRRRPVGGQPPLSFLPSLMLRYSIERLPGQK